MYALGKYCSDDSTADAMGIRVNFGPKECNEYVEPGNTKINSDSGITIN